MVGVEIAVPAIAAEALDMGLLVDSHLFGLDSCVHEAFGLYITSGTKPE